MKTNFLVLNCNEHDLHALRARLGDQLTLIPCQSMAELQQRLQIANNVGVLVNSVSASTAPEADGINGTHEGGVDVDRLVERIIEHSNGHAKTLAARVDMLERKIIEHSLNRNGQHRKDTAAELGISRVTLYNKMKKFGLLD